MKALALLLAAALPLAAADAPPATSPPFGTDLATPHQAVARIDTMPARGVLSLLTGGPQPTATLRALKESKTLSAALAAEGVNPEDFYGRLVARAAGTPDALLSAYAEKAGAYGAILDSLEGEGSAAFLLECRRVLALLPPEPKLDLTIDLVPFFGVSGFSELAAASEGGSWVFVADVPRLAGDQLGTAPPREITMKVLRGAGSTAWRSLFGARVAADPAWRERGADLDALLVRTVLEGPPMLFLIPDEFYPLDALFEEPIRRALGRWSEAVEGLADGRRKESERTEALARTASGDFWGRSAAVTGAVMTDTLLRRAGRTATVKALAAGPRAVIALWLETTRGTKLPQPTKGARKELERLLAKDAATAPAGAEKR